jgi:hypothetical protein
MGGCCVQGPNNLRADRLAEGEVQATHVRHLTYEPCGLEINFSLCFSKPLV